MADIQHLKSLLGVHPDFPKKGIVFLDIFPLLRDPLAYETLLTHFLHHITTVTIPSLNTTTPSLNGVNGEISSLNGTPATSRPGKIDVVVGLDARGFLIGPTLALRLGAAFVPVRKRGKLPGKCTVSVFEKEYGEDAFEMQEGSIQPDQNVIIVDDLIATGGSAKAAGDLVAQQGGKTVEYLFIISLPFLKGAEKLDAPVYAMIQG